MELKRPFGVSKPLGEATAREIFDECNTQLREGDLTTQSILRQFRVAVACTTDDPADPLQAHRKLAENPNPDTRVYPTWRPDKALAVADPVAWNAWIDRLSQTAKTSISNWAGLLSALESRHTAFHELGCRASDHGLNNMDAEPFTDAAAGASFDKLRSGKSVEAGEAAMFRSALLYRMALLDHARGWAQQFHLGALRGTNSRMLRLLGPIRVSIRSGISARLRRSPDSWIALTQRISWRRRLSITSIRRIIRCSRRWWVTIRTGAFRARCSGARHGGSSINWTAWKRRCACCRTWGCWRGLSAW